MFFVYSTGRSFKSKLHNVIYIELQKQNKDVLCRLSFSSFSIKSLFYNTLVSKRTKQMQQVLRIYSKQTLKHAYISYVKMKSQCHFILQQAAPSYSLYSFKRSGLAPISFQFAGTSKIYYISISFSRVPLSVFLLVYLLGTRNSKYSSNLVVQGPIYFVYYIINIFRTFKTMKQVSRPFGNMFCFQNIYAIFWTYLCFIYIVQSTENH